MKKQKMCVQIVLYKSWCRNEDKEYEKELVHRFASGVHAKFKRAGIVLSEIRTNYVPDYDSLSITLWTVEYKVISTVAQETIDMHKRVEEILSEEFEKGMMKKHHVL
ncbi:hypothetical protein ACFL2D_00680 [Patescibacteria group bacterium]